jgi:hypothetical protein
MEFNFSVPTLLSDERSAKHEDKPFTMQFWLCLRSAMPVISFKLSSH